jgi:hypothetical protein
MFKCGLCTFEHTEYAKFAKFGYIQRSPTLRMSEGDAEVSGWTETDFISDISDFIRYIGFLIRYIRY